MTMIKICFALAFVLLAVTVANAQHLGLNFQDAEKQGISIQHLDSIYKSAVHSDTTLAVFKTELQQDSLQKAYIQMLQGLGDFLGKNDFKWEKPTKCFNRIYFKEDGTIDYFVFKFLGKPEDKPSDSKQLEFQRLLNIFISDYKFPLTANEKFAQCSPTTYIPQE
jgi:hypothetical protein